MAACAPGDLADSHSPIAAQLAYWEQALAGMPERLVLPTDRPCRWPITAAPGGGEWPAELQQRVARVARAQRDQFHGDAGRPGGAAGQVSASPEVAVGFPIAGRRDPALDELVGFFVNTLVLRVEVAGDPTVAELLAQVRGRALAAYEHQDVPFEVLVDRLNPTRSLTHHPLVQVMLGWQNLPGQDNDPAAGLALGDLQVTPPPADTHRPHGSGVFAGRALEPGRCAGRDRRNGGVSHRRVRRGQHRGAHRAIRRVLVLRRSTADTTRRLSSIDLLDADEYERLDAIGNRAVLTQPVSTPVSVPVLFAAQVARTPQRWRWLR